MAQRVKLRRVWDVAESGVLFEPGDGFPIDSPILSGPGTLDQTCAQCDRVLIHGLRLGDVTSIIFCCPSCGAYNATNAGGR